MSYAAPSSPHQSVTSPSSSTPTSSHRPSLDLPPQRSRNGSPAGIPGQPAQRRTARTALRDYYNLKPSPNSPTSGSRNPSVASLPPVLTQNQNQAPSPPSPTTPTSEFDSPTFDPISYINATLSTSNLFNLLALENKLVSEIKGLDGERKALVYDNYSKLIKAMETIGHMRGNMGNNVGPKASGTLVPVMGYIADTARELLREGEAQRRDNMDQKGSMEKDKKETVRWVLGAPRRLRNLLDAGKREEAEGQWKDVRGLLDRWEGVKGVQEVKRECEGVMEPMAAEEKLTET